MATEQLGTVVRYLRQARAARAGGEVSDGTLLERFAGRRDAEAFALLVERHGPMVLALCRRVLRDPHDAEDAFQATFLVLVRKAGAIRRHDSVSSWLHGVARRTALRARGDLARRRRLEGQAAAERPEAIAAVEPDDLRPVVDDEVRRLPGKYREPVVLCYLEGATYDEAARQLGCPKGTVAIRLARARDRLRTRLERRGLAPTAGVLAAVLGERGVRAAVPASLVRSTVAAGRAGALGRPLAGLVSARVLDLTKGVLATMALSRWKAAVIGLVIVAALGVGPGLLLSQGLRAGPGDETKAAAKPAPARGQGYDPAPLARQLWDVTDVLLRDHLEPCSRQEMLLGATTGLLKAANVKAPDDLAGRASGVTAPDGFAGLLRAVVPADVAVAPDKLEEAALNGLLARLPGKGMFTPPMDTKVTEQLLANRYVGIGIQVGFNKDEHRAQIQIPLARGAARKAGARPGDLIVTVDGKDTKDKDLATVVQWLRGEEGSRVTVAARQPGETQTRTLNMVRAVIPIATVHGYRSAGEGAWDYLVDPGHKIAYARVETINSSTLHELTRLEERLRTDGARALVLDFRGTTGGLLRHAALVADGLLDGGLLWTSRDNHGQGKEYRADRECLFRGWPLVVLIDGDLTAGAATAVVAALHDNGRAVLVGEEGTYDGYVNSGVPLADGKGQIVFRSGRLERPDAAKGWPLKPDAVVELTKPLHETVHRWLADKQRAGIPGTPADQPPDDPQLAKAVSLLRERLDGSARKASGEK